MEVENILRRTVNLGKRQENDDGIVDAAINKTESERLLFDETTVSDQGEAYVAAVISLIADTRAELLRIDSSQPDLI